MAVNRGKQFESCIEQAFKKVPETSVVRLHDQTTGTLGSSNHCDYIVYKKPYEYHIECKSVHGNTLSIHSTPKPDRFGVLHGFYGAITDTQWEGLLDRSYIPGVIAGVVCWWVDKDVTRFIPIQVLEYLYKRGDKSIRYDFDFTALMITPYGEFSYPIVDIHGEKKRIFFDYDMEQFFKEVTNGKTN